MTMLGPKRLESLKKATKCESGFACLSHKIDCVCSVEKFKDNMLLFVKAPADRECVFKMPLGDSFFCVCPMRVELHRQYGI